ncbi:hypothetical protein [Flavobacterium sp.]|jgi:hypothetical protein|uniref:hypothetical protein n=1 Tax=Flavobacterium sp. TaxID=239 RepID=UPI0037BFADCD
MTSEKLAEFRAKGMLLDPKFDRLAQIGDKRKKEEDLNGSIQTIRIIPKSEYKFGETIEIEITSKGLKNQNITFKIQVFDDDSEGGIGNEVLLATVNVNAISDIVKVKIPFTIKMQDLAFGTFEGEKADCYFKVSYQNNQYSESIESERIEVSRNESLDYSEYYGQQIATPLNTSGLTHKKAVLVLNEKSQTIAYILPDEKLFIWVNDGKFQGYFEDGIKTNKATYDSYVQDKISRKTEPISWGLYLASRDSGEFVLNLIDDPKATLTGLGKALTKIATLDFDIEKVWERIQKADATDASYVVSCIMMARMASGPSKGLVNGVKKVFPAIAKKDLHKLAEIIEFYAARSANKLYSGAGGAVLTWSEILVIFVKALKFEAKITQELLKKYPIADGYIHISRLYLKVNNVVSIADNCIFNTNTGKWILNETKYGIANKLRKNQQTIENAIKADGFLEIRTATRKLEEAGLPAVIEQGTPIKISEILRSHSMDGKIINTTIQTTWP